MEVLKKNPPQAQDAHQYRLRPEDRQAIQAQSTFTKTRQKIDRQRREFMAQNFGCEFGLKTQ